ncbi:hypothetical protein F5Y16DRAFT_268570 [Xylariaceae sp. FL0255]|nr:hypothetical protein F5Y16DRAFT_268570 [Xylariaceae sp. FL0255]
MWKQHWISQGINFINQLESAPTWAAKREVLSSGPYKGKVNLYEVLERSCTSDNGAALNFYADEEISQLIPRRDEDNLDEGSFRVWKKCYGIYNLARCILEEDNGANRICAYVFWDLERVQRHSLLGVFGWSATIMLDHTPNEQAYQEMQRSFEERSRPWKKGERGYCISNPQS